MAVAVDSWWGWGCSIGDRVVKVGTDSPAEGEVLRIAGLRLHPGDVGVLEVVERIEASARNGCVVGRGRRNTASPLTCDLDPSSAADVAQQVGVDRSGDAVWVQGHLSSGLVPVGIRIGDRGQLDVTLQVHQGQPLVLRATGSRDPQPICLLSYNDRQQGLRKPAPPFRHAANPSWIGTVPGDAVRLADGAIELAGYLQSLCQADTLGGYGL